jgi:predicted permease
MIPRADRGAFITLVGVLALTAAVTAASLDVMASYLWRPLPYPAADRLVVADYPRPGGPSPRDLQAVDPAAVPALAELAVASDPDSFTVLGGDVPFTTDGRWIDGDVFAMFNVRPVLGRAFTRGEAARGEPLALIADHVWRDHFGGRDDVIGRLITVRATIRQGSPETFTIVGVLPPRFWHVEERTSLLLPMRAPRVPWLMRLRAGVSMEEAGRRLTAMVREQVPGVSADWSAVVRDAQDAHVERVRPMLAAIGWGVVLLAAVALANLACLQMARGVARQREFAVRSVLGASRRALLRHGLAEGLVSGGAAALGGALIAFLLLRAGVPAIEGYFGRVMPSGTTWSPGALLSVMAATVMAGLLLSAVMFAAAKSAALPGALAGGSSITDTPRRLLIRQLIVSGQITVAFALFVGAALMMKTALHLGALDLGFEPRGVLSASVTLPDSTYRSLDRQLEFYRALVERLDRLPDVTHAGVTGWLPFRVGPAVIVQPEGSPDTVAAAMQGVDAGYLGALQLRLREGRWIAAEDDAARGRVAVIGQSLSRALWAGKSPLGRQLRIRFSPAPGRGFGPYTVIGVVDDVRQSVMSETPPQLYLSFQQQPVVMNGFLQLRTMGRPLEAAPAVARVVRDMDPELALGSVNSLENLVEADGMRPRQLARALAAFAALAIVIAVIGLHAVSAWIAHLRQREAALRVALGASRSSVAALLARRGAIAIGMGLVLGWMASTLLASTLAAEMRGVAAGDLPTRVAVALVLLLISLAALFGPAWRVSAANLTALLRME